ncbi:MAG TPA: DPP IV N-terminal domain-containing protein, partial [Chitinophagaceae bacterium]|nr:DPP IV N-terminal domain-containing protein [Chitinophagaceae bacterium]
MRNLIVALLLFPVFAIAQKKQITLEDIYKKGVFRGEFVAADFGRVPNRADIPETLRDEKGKLLEKADDIIYSSVHPRIVLIRTNVESIYRRSTKANVYVYDTLMKKVVSLDESKVLHPTLSPDGSKVAFVKDNNLYIKDLATSEVKAVTTDGKWNHIINGNCDWVYEEEFEFTRAYQWSPKGNYIAYYRFDETDVKEYNMTLYDNTYNQDYRYKYPKAGEANSKVEIHIYELGTGKDVKAQFEQGDIYIPRIKWTRDDNKLVVFWMNRHQDHLKLLATDVRSGQAETIYEEKNKYFVEINDDWWFLKDGKNLLFTSEMDGFRHLYMQGLDGKKLVQVTKGNHEITEINGVDETNKRIYYTMAYPRPLDRNLFVTDFTGKNTRQLTEGEGWHRTVMNDDFTQYYVYRTDINTPQVVTLHQLKSSRKGITTQLVKTVNESQKLRNTISQYDLGKAEFI